MLQRRGLEKEKEKTVLKGAKPPNLLIIALCGLASFCLHPCPLCSCLGSRTLAPSIPASCVYMKRQRKKPADKQRNEQRRQGEHAKNILPKKAKQRQTKHSKHMKEANKHVIKQEGVSQEDKCWFRLSVRSSIGLKYGRTTHRLMHEEVHKRATRKHRSKDSQTGGVKQARQAYQHCMEWRKLQNKHTDISEVYLRNGHIQTYPRKDGYNHTSTSPRRAQSMAKPRSREVTCR